ncbi:MAG TPA: hypothetical protein VFW80_09065 [Gaiellaceae bacterium]|nr:hypothetical protein [Gaiellaceae bacterium]
MVYEYRVFLELGGEELSFSHFSGEKLWPGAVVRANRPGSPLHGQQVAVERVASHPTEDAPGIAYGRGA